MAVQACCVNRFGDQSLYSKQWFEYFALSLYKLLCSNMKPFLLKLQNQINDWVLFIDIIWEIYRRCSIDMFLISGYTYSNKLLFDIPKYMKQQLQKVQNPVAGFVLNECTNINDVTNIKWLLMEELTEYSLAIMGMKLKLTQSNNKRSLIDAN